MKWTTRFSKKRGVSNRTIGCQLFPLPCKRRKKKCNLPITLIFIIMSICVFITFHVLLNLKLLCLKNLNDKRKIFTVTKRSTEQKEQKGKTGMNSREEFSVKRILPCTQLFPAKQNISKTWGTLNLGNMPVVTCKISLLTRTGIHRTNSINESC